MINHGGLSSKVLATMRTRPTPLEVFLPQVANQGFPIDRLLTATNPTTFVLRTGIPCNPVAIPQVNTEIFSFYRYIAGKASRDPTTYFDPFVQCMLN